MVAVNINVEVTAVKGALDQLKTKIPNSTRKALNKTGMFLQSAIKDRTGKGTVIVKVILIRLVIVIVIVIIVIIIVMIIVIVIP